MSSTTTTQEPILYLYTNDIPVWLQVLLGITAAIAGLLLMTCLLLCCMRLCGCWSGNILGVGNLRRPLEEGDHMGCWCCRPMPFARSRIDDGDGSYVIQLRKDGTRSTPSTPRGIWMPHTHPVRNNNTSTH